MNNTKPAWQTFTFWISLAGGLSALLVVVAPAIPDPAVQAKLLGFAAVLGNLGSITGQRGAIQHTNEKLGQ